MTINNLQPVEYTLSKSTNHSNEDEGGDENHAGESASAPKQLPHGSPNAQSISSGSGSPVDLGDKPDPKLKQKYFFAPTEVLAGPTIARLPRTHATVYATETPESQFSSTTYCNQQTGQCNISQSSHPVEEASHLDCHSLHSPLGNTLDVQCSILMQSTDPKTILSVSIPQMSDAEPRNMPTGSAKTSMERDQRYKHYLQCFQGPVYSLFAQSCVTINDIDAFEIIGACNRVHEIKEILRELLNGINKKEIALWEISHDGPLHPQLNRNLFNHVVTINWSGVCDDDDDAGYMEILSKLHTPLVIKGISIRCKTDFSVNISEYYDQRATNHISSWSVSSVELYSQGQPCDVKLSFGQGQRRDSGMILQHAIVDPPARGSLDQSSIYKEVQFLDVELDATPANVNQPVEKTKFNIWTSSVSKLRNYRTVHASPEPQQPGDLTNYEASKQVPGSSNPTYSNGLSETDNEWVRDEVILHRLKTMDNFSRVRMPRNEWLKPILCMLVPCLLGQFVCLMLHATDLSSLGMNGIDLAANCVTVLVVLCGSLATFVPRACRYAHLKVSELAILFIGATLIN